MNWTAVIVAGIALIGTVVNSVFLYKAQKIRSRKDSEKSNPSPNAVPSFLCFAHGEKLTKLELKLNTACENIRTLQHDVQTLKEKDA